MTPGDRGGNGRKCPFRFFSPLLYQLSYLAVNRLETNGGYYSLLERTVTSNFAMDSFVRYREPLQSEAGKTVLSIAARQQRSASVFDRPILSAGLAMAGDTKRSV